MAPQRQAAAAARRINVVWFKCTDLRTHDHAALKAAHAEGLPVLHLYVFDPFWHSNTTRVAGFPKTGALRTRFQLEALADLGVRLQAEGHNLCTRSGVSTAACFDELCADYEVNAVFAFHEICSEELAVEARVRNVLRRHRQGPLRLFWGFELYHHDDLSFDPLRPRGAFNSYTAFRKRVEESSRVRPSEQEAPAFASGVGRAVAWPRADADLPSVREAMGKAYDAALDPGEEKDGRAELHWKGGETAALERVRAYLWEDDSLGLEYVGATMTTDPAKSCMRDKAMSKFSPWLAHGCLSPRWLYEEVKRYERERQKNKSTYWITHELLWRDFSRFGSLSAGTSIFKIGGPSNTRPSWRWSTDKQLLSAWRDGLTGFPFVDCFMRELKTTGYCNHMGRECSGWFLIGDLGMDWRMGAEWFESVLVDYEPCANWFNWTYRCLPAAARGGSDGFLVDNPGHRLQGLEILKWGTQHDPDATYIKRWIPELASLPATTAREPWRLGLTGGGGGGGGGELRPLPTSGRFTVNRTALQSLLDMGFEQEAAAMALYRAWEDPDAAATLILSESGGEGGGAGEEDDDLARAMALSLQDSGGGGGAGPVSVEDSDEEAPRQGRGGRPSRAFRYGIDYPHPVITPVSLRGTEGEEAQARRAQAERDRQIAAAKRRRADSSSGRGGGFSKEGWEAARRRRQAKTPTAAVPDRGREDSPGGKGKGGPGKGGGAGGGPWGRRGAGGQGGRQPGGGYPAEGGGGEGAERKRRWGAKDAARAPEAEEERLRGA